MSQCSKDSHIRCIQVLQQFMSQSIGSDQDELIQQLFGITTPTLFPYYDQQPQILPLQPLETPSKLQDSQEQISHHLFYSHSEQPQTFPYSQEDFSRPQETSREAENAASRSSEGSGRAGRREKNSNAIKKIGRIILDNLREYREAGGNGAVSAMLKLLSRDSKVGRTEVNKRDKFNTYHLRALFGGKDPQQIARNLRTTRAILSRHLRNNVLGSRQISDRNKALYLNTMKCSVLRCSNRALAVRLQMAAEH